MTDTVPGPEELLTKYGRNRALVYDGRELSGAFLVDKIRLFAGILERAGTVPGDRIILRGKNSPDLFCLIMAALLRGAAAFPIDPKLPAGVIRHLYKETGYALLLDLEEDPLPPRMPGDAFCWNDMARRYGPTARTDLKSAFAPEADATILLTSGSSGRPKPVVHSYSNHYYSALGSNEHITLNPGDAWLVILPMFHAGGLSIFFRCLLAGAVPVIASEQKSLLQNLEDPAVTHVSLVWTQLYRLMEKENAIPLLKRKKAILVGGGPPARPTLDHAVEKDLPLFVSYGSTEMASQIATTRPGNARGAAKLLPYRNIRTDSSKEIYVRGRTLFKGYAAASGILKPFDSEGWFCTGDMGEIDKNGFLKVLGRTDNMFVSGGENIHPEEIESVLQESGYFERALVVDIPDDEFGTRPLAFVIPARGRRPDNKKVNAFLKNKLPSYKIPLHYLTWPGEVDKDKPSRQACRQIAAERIRS